MKCKQSEAERRLSNLELKAGLLPELRKIINTPKVRSIGKQVELNPSVKTRVPQDSWIWTGSWVPGQMNCPICYPWLAYQETQDPEKGTESPYTPEGGITQRLELLHLQKCWLGWVMAAPGDTSDKEPDNADVRDTGSIPRWGRAPEGGNGNPLHYSCLKNPIDRTRGCKESDTTGETWQKAHTAIWGLPRVASGKASTCQCRGRRSCGFSLWAGKIPWRRAWQPIQYSCLGNSMDRGAWWATVYGITKIRT